MHAYKSVGFSFLLNLITSTMRSRNNKNGSDYLSAIEIHRKRVNARTFVTLNSVSQVRQHFCVLPSFRTSTSNPTLPTSGLGLQVLGNTEVKQELFFSELIDFTLGTSSPAAETVKCILHKSEICPQLYGPRDFEFLPGPYWCTSEVDQSPIQSFIGGKSFQWVLKSESNIALKQEQGVQQQNLAGGMVISLHVSLFLCWTIST